MTSMCRAIYGFGFASLILATGCSSKSTPCTYAYGGSAAEFMGALAYPAPNATGVSTSTQTLIFFNPSGAVSIEANGGAAIQTTPTALPDPLPSPLTGQPTTGLSAVSVPALQSATTYQTGVYSDINDCETNYTFRAIGSFTTQ